MESIQNDCEQCGSEQKHTFRMYEQRTKHYSVISGRPKRSVTIICHGCLLEGPLDKGYEKQMIEKFTGQVIVAEGFELYQQGNYNKAMKKFQKNLKDDPGNLQAVYGLATCLIAKGEYDEARVFVGRLDSEMPDNEDVRELKQTLAKH
jgi:tetratricopeptide (TPR) repeat protein